MLYLMSYPVKAKDSTICVELLKGYFREQFVINSKDDPKQWWQVFDGLSGMYNHIANNWSDKEHLMSVGPMYPETQAHIIEPSPCQIAALYW